MASCSIHILSSLNHASLTEVPRKAFYFSLRKLSSLEIPFIRQHSLQRYYLKTISNHDEGKFISDFNEFWNSVIAGKEALHPFWRCGVSSKMQEWENSIGYFALSLYCLTKDADLSGKDLIILTEDFQEALVWQQWATKQGHHVVVRGFNCFENVQKKLENTARVLRLILIYVKKKLQAKKVYLFLRDGAVLIITLFYRQSLNRAEYEDQFFGKLHEDVKTSGKDFLYLADAIDGISFKDAKALGQHNRPVSIYSVISWLDLCQGIRSILSRKVKFDQCCFQGIDCSALLEWYQRRVRYDFNWTAEFFYRAVNKVCSRFDFSKMLYIFEGNVYERACLQAFREQMPGRSIDAYSHAVVYPLNLKLWRSSLERSRAPEPDRYLFGGVFMKDQLERLRFLENKAITACFLRNIPRSIERKKQNSKEILVVLDGVWSTIILCRWLYEHAEVFKGYTVTLRMHPNVSGEQVLNQCAYFKKDLFNISTESLEKDLSRAYCVIYRHSSVGVIALLNGIPIIHLNIDSPLNGDPLMGFDIGKITVSNAEMLRKALGNIDSLQKDLTLGHHKVDEFLSSYFIEASMEKKRIFLEDVHKSKRIDHG